MKINELLADRRDDRSEPIDFGVDAGMETEHRLFALDLTPNRWERLDQSLLALPQGWCLENVLSYFHPACS